MPIFFQQEIDGDTRLAIWKIEEEEAFFQVALQRDITHPHKRLQHLAGRYLLKYLFPDFPLELIRIADTRKPYLEDEAFHFSISHCSDYAAAIVSRNKRVGVDIEVPSPKVEKIKHKFLHTDELTRAIGNRKLVRSKKEGAINDIVESTTSQPINYSTIQRLTLLWSAKEAVFKWWSYGSVDFSEMIRLDDFSLSTDGIIRSRFHAPERSYDLDLHYRLFQNICLAWIVDGKV